jgi:zinc protease
MRTRLAVALLAVAVAAIAAQGQPHWSDATRRVLLENGLTVLMLERGELPIVSVQALYRVGSRNERPGQTGAAHYVEHMAFRSTEEIAKRDLTNQILRWGGRWNGYTSYDQTVYGSHTPSEYLEWLLYLERQRMRHVRFDEDEVARERTSVISEERQYQNSPIYTLVEHRLRRAALVAHPYGSPIMGRMSDLEGVTPRELERFYREGYAPNNLILAVVGRFDPEQALALVEKHFAGAPGDGASTAIRTVEPVQQGPRRIVMRARSGASHVELAVHAPSASSPDFATLLALDGVLAGGKAPGRDDARPGSRLHRALVESGLATSVTTEVELSEYPGLYSIGIDAARDADLAAIENGLDAALRDAMDKMSEDEVARAARRVRADLAFTAASNRAVANLLTVYEQMGTYKLLASIPRRLDALTADAVRAFARQRLAPDRRSVGLLIPESSAPSSEAPSARSGAPEEAAVPEPTAAPPVERRTTRPIPPPRLEIPTLTAPVIRRLDNGLTVLALRVPGESAHLRVRIAAGSRFDQPGREGTALLAARLLTVGADSPLSTLEDRDVRLSLGAFDDDDPFTVRNVVEISATSLPGELTNVAAALLPAITTPAFRTEDLERMRVSVADELGSHQEDSRWRAGRAAFDRLYANVDPYDRPAEGTDESRARIAVADLSAFHKAHYRPERTIVAIAGPMDPVAAIEQVADAFGGWRADAGSAAGPAAAAGQTSARQRREIAPAPSRIDDRIVHVPLDKEQASIAVALPGVARGDRDFAALAALNYLLGETGYAGRLGERLVDTGLAYAVYSSVLADREAGPILITTDAVRARDAVDRIVATLDEFAKQGITDAELREAKGFLLGRLLFRFESAASATAALADLGYLGDQTSPEVFARRVLDLTREEVSAAARRYYDPSRAVIVVAGRW